MTSKIGKQLSRLHISPVNTGVTTKDGAEILYSTRIVKGETKKSYFYYKDGPRKVYLSKKKIETLFPSTEKDDAADNELDNRGE